MKFLSQPYPLLESSGRKFLNAFLVGLFVTLFLFVFRPFGLNTIAPDETFFILSGYGLTCFIILLFNQFLIPALLPGVFQEPKWTVGKDIVYILFCVFTIGVGNMIYTNSILSYSYGFSSMVYFQITTLSVAVIPVTINVLLKQIYLLRKNLSEAKTISLKMHHKKRLDATPDLKVLLTSENRKDSLSIIAINILFISAADNYIDVHYLEDGIEKQKLIRSTLKAAKEDLRNHNAFYRCHRTWIVNLDHVISVTGNSQGYRLILKGTSVQIPVSRNLNQELTARLAK